MQWWVSVGAVVMAAAAWLSQGTGGSLAVRLPDNPVQPIGISVQGPVEREVTLVLGGAREVVVRGLPTGRYDIRPRFAGTVSGPSVAAQVVEGSGTTVELPISQVGGVRFDTDPGMCEPEFEWSFTPAAIFSANQPALVPVEGAPLPTSLTCLREIAGLSPGAYRVRVIPPRHELPEYSAIVRIEATAWTAHRIPFPPVVVRGRITSHGEPLPGVQVTFTPTPATLAGWQAGGRSLTSSSPMTDDEGRYAAALHQPGIYRQAFKQLGQELVPGLTEEVSVAPGINQHDIEVGGGRLKVWLTERGSAMAPDRVVTLTIQSLPQAPVRHVIPNPSEPFDVRVITPGRYTVSATAPSTDAQGRPILLVSARRHEVTIASMMTADVSLDLIHRGETWLEVVHSDGAPGEGAYVVPHPGAPSLRADDHGRVSLETVPVGTRLPIRTRMWGITCHTVTDDSVQRVVVPDATETLVLTWTKSNDVLMGRRALGGSTISGIPGATCPVPFEGLSVGESRVSGRVDFRAQLPPGVYTLTLRDGRIMTVTAPGRYDVS